MLQTITPTLGASHSEQRSQELKLTPRAPKQQTIFIPDEPTPKWTQNTVVLGPKKKHRHKQAWHGVSKVSSPITARGQLCLQLQRKLGSLSKNASEAALTEVSQSLEVSSIYKT